MDEMAIVRFFLGAMLISLTILTFFLLGVVFVTIVREIHEWCEENRVWHWRWRRWWKRRERR